MGTWADFNATFAVDAIASLEAGVSCHEVRPAWTKQEWQSIGGLQAAACQIEHSNGRVEI
jgi:hypothetical protein